MSLAAATDIGITMVMILIFHRSKTGFKGSTDLLNRLIMFTLNTFVLLKMSLYHLSHDFSSLFLGERRRLFAQYYV